MGCGAVGGQKYQAPEAEVNTLHHLGDDHAAKRPSPGSAGQRPVAAASGPGHAGSLEGGDQGLHVSSGNSPNVSDRYRAGQALEGVEVLEGESDVRSVVAAANDRELLRKYAETGPGGNGKRRAGSSKRVFAPAGEPLRYNQEMQEAEPMLRAPPEEFGAVSNRTVGGLTLQHSSLAAPSQAGVRVAAR
jgi:hypothetical protein